MSMKIFFAILILIISCFAYFGITYIDKEVTTGEAYGVKVGSTKRESFDMVKESFGDRKVYILSPINELGVGPHKIIHFREDDYLLIKDMDVWTFYFNEGFFDILRLSFNENSVTKIYRHRKKFELP